MTRHFDRHYDDVCITGIDGSCVQVKPKRQTIIFKLCQGLFQKFINFKRSTMNNAIYKLVVVKYVAILYFLHQIYAFMLS